MLKPEEPTTQTLHVRVLSSDKVRLDQHAFRLSVETGAYTTTHDLVRAILEGYLDTHDSRLNPIRHASPQDGGSVPTPAAST